MRLDFISLCNQKNIEIHKKDLKQFVGKRTMVFPRIGIGLQDTPFRPQILTGQITEVIAYADKEPLEKTDTASLLAALA